MSKKAASSLILPNKELVKPVNMGPTPANELRRLTPEDLPLKALTWHLIVEPRLPKSYSGSIQLAEETKQVEEIQTTIGTILSKGSLFGASRTAGGVMLNDDALFAKLKVGDHVLYARHVGQKVSINVEGKRRPIVILTDTEIMCHVEGDMERIMFWI